jgi:hypothetical protein
MIKFSMEFKSGKLYIKLFSMDDLCHVEGIKT